MMARRDDAFEIVEFVEEVGGIYFRSIVLPFKGMTIPQHVHSEPHATYVGSGAARLYIDYREAVDVQAGHAIEVAAGKRHWFEALEDNTRLVCVWSSEAAAREMKARGL